MHVVYALHDPRDRRVRYIGCTSLPLKVRVSSHLSSARCGGGDERARWLRDLLSEGLRPRVQHLASARDAGVAAGLEYGLIAAYRASGHALTNRQLAPTKGQPLRARPVRLRTLLRELGIRGPIGSEG